MDKSNLELFKQALNEAVSNKFDKIADECTEEIVYSERHKLAMRTIVYGKADTKRVWSPKMRRIIAILIAVALLLTSCGIIFRNEIREIFKDLFVSLTYEGEDTSDDMIEEIYVLGYVPEGYILEKENLSYTVVRYIYTNLSEESIRFEQRTKVGSDYYIDSESGYSKIEEIEEYAIYYRLVNNFHCYVWSDEKYSMKMKTSKQLSNDVLVLMLDGITIK